jgi:hypothetical protein
MQQKIYFTKTWCHFHNILKFMCANFPKTRTCNTWLSQRILFFKISNIFLYYLSKPKMQSKGRWGEGGTCGAKSLIFFIEKADGLAIGVVVTPSLNRDGMVFRGHVLPYADNFPTSTARTILCRRLFSMPTAAISPTCPTSTAYLGRRPCCWAARLGTSTDGAD